MKTTAIVLCAGKSTRMGGKDKLLAFLGEDVVFMHSVRAFTHSVHIDEVVVVVSAENLDKANKLETYLVSTLGRIEASVEYTSYDQLFPREELVMSNHQFAAEMSHRYDTSVQPSKRQINTGHQRSLKDLDDFMKSDLGAHLINLK